MRSPVSVPSDASAPATDDRVDDMQSLAQRAPAHAHGHDGSQAAAGAIDSRVAVRQAGVVSGGAVAGQPQADGVAATGVAAKTAIALAVLLADVRDILRRLTELGEGPNDGERRELLAAALAKVNRGDRFASELLAYSGRQRLAPEAVELLPLLCSLADLLRRTLDKRIEVTVQVDDDCPPCHVDARALEVALFSLAVNARDAMPQGGRMHFTARRAASANGASAVALTLLDTGAGMATATSAVAARPFFTTKANDPLAGLGLSAVEGFVRQSGGSMALQAWMGTGTVITLCLPPARRDG